MKSAVFFVLLNAFVVYADRIDSTLFKLTDRPNVIPNRFIIEVESTSSLESLDRRGGGFHVGLSNFDHAAMLSYSATASRHGIPPDQVSCYPFPCNKRVQDGWDFQRSRTHC